MSIVVYLSHVSPPSSLARWSCGPLSSARGASLFDHIFHFLAHISGVYRRISMEMEALWPEMPTGCCHDDDTTANKLSVIYKKYAIVAPITSRKMRNACIKRRQRFMILNDWLWDCNDDDDDEDNNNNNNNNDNNNNNNNNIVCQTRLYNILFRISNFENLGFLKLILCTITEIFNLLELNVQHLFGYLKFHKLCSQLNNKTLMT